jgi:outer membrane protein TolC
LVAGTAICAAMIACAGGCGVLGGGNPFATSDADVKRLALSRLREVEPMSTVGGLTAAQATAQTRDEASLRQEVLALRQAFLDKPTLGVSLEEARASALAHNLNLQVAVLEPAIARERINEEAARFSAVFDAGLRYEDSRRATGSRVSTQTTTQSRLTPALRVPMRTGGEVSVETFAARVEQDNEFAELPEFYNSGATVSISQPLLRNAGRRVNLAGLRIATYDAQASMARTKLETIAQLAEVERAYWRLYAARATLDVRAQQIALADEQLATSRRRVENGASAQVEVDRSRAGLAQRVEALLQAQNDVLDAQRVLKQIMNKPGLTLDTPTALVPSTTPDPVEYVLDRASLQQSARANRMELVELELQLAADAARVLLERNGTLPDVRFLASYGASGLDDQLGGSLQDALDRESREWSVGGSLSMPLDNEAARSRLRASLLSRLQRGRTKDAREQEIAQQTLRAADALETSWQRILATRIAAIAAGTALASEQRQFGIGASTSTNVLDAASNLAEAQLAEIQALRDYQISLVDLSVATGTMLGAAKIDLDVSAPVPSVEIGDSERIAE